MYKHIFSRGLNRGWVTNPVGTPLHILILIAPPPPLPVTSFDLVCKLKKKSQEKKNHNYLRFEPHTLSITDSPLFSRLYIKCLYSVIILNAILNYTCILCLLFTSLPTFCESHCKCSILHFYCL